MRAALFALTTGAFAIGVCEFVVMGLLLEVSEDLAVDLPAAGWLVSSYALGVVIGGPAAALLAAGRSRKRALLVLMGLFIAGNVLCAVGESFEIVLLGRVVSALTHGAYFGIGSVVAMDLTPPHRKASAVAVLFTGLTLATVLGVPLGSWLGQAVDWRATFWAIAAAGAVATATLQIFLPATADQEGRPDRRSALALATRPVVILALATTVFGYAGVFMAYTYIAPMLTQITGLSESAVAPTLLLFGAGLVVGNLVGGRAADRYPRGAIFGSLGALALVLLLFTPSLTGPASAAAAVALLGAAAFATVAPLQSWILARAEGGDPSFLASLNIAAFNLGNALGAWIAGRIIETGLGLAAIAPLAACAPILAAGLFVCALRADAGARRRAARSVR